MNRRRLARKTKFNPLLSLRSWWFRALAAVCYRRLILLELDLEKLPAKTGAEGLGVLSELNEQDWEEYMLFDRQLDADEIRRRQQAGHDCVTLRMDGVLACGTWAVAGPGTAYVSYVDRAMTLAAGERYSYDAITAPFLRGRGVTPKIWQWFLGWGRDTGLKRNLAAVLPENMASRAVCSRTGYRPIALIGYVRLGPWRRDFTRPAPRRYR